jgi:chromate transporter
MNLPVLLDLFLTFLKIGAIMFGGGYAMIPILRYEVVVRHHWLSESEFIDLIAIAESTPGPIAINSATYIGYKIGGVLGSALATMGVIIPPFTVILVIATFLQRFYENFYVRSVLNGIRGAIVGLVMSALITIIRGTFKGLGHGATIATAIIAIAAFIAVELLDVDPIVVIALSALAGIALGLLGVWQL